jgi:putative flippase GtrA
MSHVDIAGQIGRFFLVGLAAAVGHYGTYILLIELLGETPVPSSAAGFIVGALISYTLNYVYTFRSEKDHREATVKFLTVALIGLVVNSGLVGLFTGPLAIHYLLAQVAATLIVMGWSFTANRYWTFGAAG